MIQDVFEVWKNLSLTSEAQELFDRLFEGFIHLKLVQNYHKALESLPQEIRNKLTGKIDLISYYNSITDGDVLLKIYEYEYCKTQKDSFEDRTNLNYRKIMYFELTNLLAEYGKEFDPIWTRINPYLESDLELFKSRKCIYTLVNSKFVDVIGDQLVVLHCTWNETNSASNCPLNNLNSLDSILFGSIRAVKDGSD